MFIFWWYRRRPKPQPPAPQARIVLMRHRYPDASNPDYYMLHVIENGHNQQIARYDDYPQGVAAVQMWNAYMEAGGTLARWLADYELTNHNMKENTK
jgi:hypothetical protein